MPPISVDMRPFAAHPIDQHRPIADPAGMPLTAADYFTAKLPFETDTGRQRRPVDPLTAPI